MKEFVEAWRKVEAEASKEKHIKMYDLKKVSPPPHT
jgi:hypothetical protein